MVTSSRVRIEMMQATSCSNGELKPSSASSNIAALAKGRTAARTRRMTSSMSKGRFGAVMTRPLPSSLRNLRALGARGGALGITFYALQQIGFLPMRSKRQLLQNAFEQREILFHLLA